MKFLLLILFAASLLWASCGDRRASNESTEQKEIPGIGKALDTANRKLDSAIKAPDTVRRNP